MYLLIKSIRPTIEIQNHYKITNKIWGKKLGLQLTAAIEKVKFFTLVSSSGTICGLKQPSSEISFNDDQGEYLEGFFHIHKIRNFTLTSISTLSGRDLSA
jgi:hypothetical protein